MQDRERLIRMMEQLHGREAEILLRLVGDRLAHDTGTILHSLLGLITLAEEEEEPGSPLLRQMRAECARLEGKILELLEDLRPGRNPTGTFTPLPLLEELVASADGICARLWLLPVPKGEEGPQQLCGDPITFLELVWAFVRELSSWQPDSGEPGVGLAWAGKQGDGLLRLEAPSGIIPSSFRNHFAICHLNRGKILDAAPRPWMIIEAALTEFQATALLPDRAPEGGPRLEILFPRREIA